MDWLHDILHRSLEWVEGFASTPYGDWALFALAFAESSFFPIPPDVLLIALCLGRPELSFWFALICSTASILGGMLGYTIGFYGGRPVLKRLFSPQKIQAVESLYDRYNAWATGIAGLTPIPYKIFTIAGGAFSINFKIFVLASILSRSFRFFAVATLFFFFGEPVKVWIDEYLNVLSIVFVVLLIVGYYVVTHVFVRTGPSKEEEADESAKALHD